MLGVLRQMVVSTDGVIIWPFVAVNSFYVLLIAMSALQICRQRRGCYFRGRRDGGGDLSTLRTHERVSAHDRVCSIRTARIPADDGIVEIGRCLESPSRKAGLRCDEEERVC